MLILYCTYSFNRLDFAMKCDLMSVLLRFIIPVLFLFRRSYFRSGFFSSFWSSFQFAAICIFWECAILFSFMLDSYCIPHSAHFHTISCLVFISIERCCCFFFFWLCGWLVSISKLNVAYIRSLCMVKSFPPMLLLLLHLFILVSALLSSHTVKFRKKIFFIFPYPTL